MQHEIIIAGFGGQGILSSGRLIAYAGMLENKNVSWLPSYGPEMRGGTANCHVVVSDELVGSPILNQATEIIVMNEPSLEKFENWVRPGGVVIIDSSLVEALPKRDDVETYRVPATQTALEMGNKTFAGVILLGKLLSSTQVVKRESLEKALYGILPEKKHYMIPDEIKALKIGMEY